MAITQWTTLLQQCMLNRTAPQDFVTILQTKPNLNGRIIVRTLLECRQSFCAARDPLPPRYFETLLSSHLITISDILVVLINKWNRAIYSSILEADVTSLHEITALLNSRLSIDRLDTERCLLLSARWLMALIRSMSQSEDASNGQVAEAVGPLLATLCATSNGIEILSEKRDGNKKMAKVVETVKQALEAGVGAFPALGVQLIERLGTVQKHITMFDEVQQEQSSLQALQIQASIPELPMSFSRAGTIVYLEAMVLTARTVDDTIVFNFLAGRHSNDWTAMFIDVISASFQVLKRSYDSPQSHVRYPQAELFIHNKLPSIMSTISASSFGALSSEQAVTSSWQQIKSELTNPDLLRRGHEFLHICSMHHLLSSEIAHDLIDDQELISKLSKRLVSKDDLISQVHTNHARIQKLVDELAHADGSGGTISQAIAEIIITHCQNKETHHLRDLANAMLKTPDAINALAMFVRPSYWIGPLCTLLDEWRWNEIHGESQPVYEEFGSILLLVVASKRRLDLTVSEMGMQEEFVARYLDQEGIESATLSEDATKHLGEWIYAMYVADALSDEVTTACSPQDFYLLLPNLLRQSMLANQTGKLSLDALKGGLEYLLEPFLLPSLVSAITWARQDATAKKLLMPIFTKPSENEVHQTILAMMGNEAWSFKLEQGGDFDKDAAACIGGGGALLLSSLQTLTQVRGPEAALQSIIRTLTTSLSTALDVMATLICVSDRQLRDLLRLKFMTLKDTASAGPIVHLHRRVEAYASVLLVQEMPMEFVQQLTNIDTTDANLDTNLDATQEHPEDEIDQVLNANAMSMEQPDMTTDVAMEDFYGMQNDNMGLDLDDLDLDMF